MLNPNPEVIEVGYAEALPSEDRLSRFQRLANLQISRVTAFNKWAKDRGVSEDQKEIAQEAWNAAWNSMRTDALFDVVRRLAVFDESFRLPQLNVGSDEFRGDVEKKFGKIMNLVSVLAQGIQVEYEKKLAEDSNGSIHTDI